MKSNLFNALIDCWLMSSDQYFSFIHDDENKLKNNTLCGTGVGIKGICL